MVEAALNFVTHFPIPPIYPYLPFALGYLIMGSVRLPASLEMPYGRI